MRGKFVLALSHQTWQCGLDIGSQQSVLRGWPVEMPSNSQIKKVGSRIRGYLRGSLSEHAYRQALITMTAYRAQFSRPTAAINSALRRHAKQADVDARVTQRLKKTPTIIDKLAQREQSLNLLEMHDIGGCRAVVKDISAMDRLVDTVVNRSSERLLKHRDYVESPRDSGYRAHHLIIESSAGLPIELQIRTTSMHAWADTVEGFSTELGINFKQDGEGPMFEFLKIVAEIYWHEEIDTPVGPELSTRYNELLIEVNDFIARQKPVTYGQQKLPF